MFKKYVQRQLKRYVESIILPGSSALEIEAGDFSFLQDSGLTEKSGLVYGKDIAPLKDKFTGESFFLWERKKIPFDKKFDYVIINGLINEQVDAQDILLQVKSSCKPDSRVILARFSPLWKFLFKTAEILKLIKHTPCQFLSDRDLTLIFDLSGYQEIKEERKILLPMYIPLISSFFNRVLSGLPWFGFFSLYRISILRPVDNGHLREDLSCSVIIPCRNEAGNIEPAVRRIPAMGRHTELIFVEGHSKDTTLSECYRVQKSFPEKDIKVLRQDDIGKGDAVRKGFSQAKGDILMILDADLTVAPEDLPKFFNAAVLGKGEFINGSRLIYPMQRHAMRRLNLLANRFFSRVFSFLLNQHLTDTLCGTKVLSRDNYLKIAKSRAYFGDFDPFGDFDLLFGASRLNLKITEIPVRYYARGYGKTQIRRFRDGWQLLKMTALAMRKIKFI